jgi:hypothetical protein
LSAESRRRDRLLKLFIGSIGALLVTVCFSTSEDKVAFGRRDQKHGRIE